jgi:hypothetical protein
MPTLEVISRHSSNEFTNVVDEGGQTNPLEMPWALKNLVVERRRKVSELFMSL